MSRVSSSVSKTLTQRISTYFYTYIFAILCFANLPWIEWFSNFVYLETRTRRRYSIYLFQPCFSSKVSRSVQEAHRRINDFCEHARVAGKFNEPDPANLADPRVVDYTVNERLFPVPVDNNYRRSSKCHKNDKNLEKRNSLTKKTQEKDKFRFILLILWTSSSPTRLTINH